MGKYASGTSMRNIILQETQKVEMLLRSSNLAEPAQEMVLSAFRQMAYNWCGSNAYSCAIVEAAKSLYGADAETEIGRELIHMSRSGNDVRGRKMQETYPFE